MHNSVNSLISIKKEIQEINKNVTLIAVTKTFNIEKIQPIIDCGHNDFGENKVQEAYDKWSNLKNTNKNIKLHLIGKLQSNKVKFCFPLFDYIHGLDSLKLADKIANEQVKKNFKPKIFIQINIGNEEQKGGIKEIELINFYEKIKKDFDLNIIGLMCIPPFNDNTTPFFSKMKKLSELIKLKELSMGMSNDYIEAVKNSSTFVRIGSKIMGSRS
ncbi:YggS family pyridoxal phosphate-dependent enzyme [Pelagibacterales bacterium SAG-MED15]|nr:YggS family pyridoxal phosphate-dependent enzyme [Pelagibacterales bacterium SAG-MED15]